MSSVNLVMDNRNQGFTALLQKHTDTLFNSDRQLDEANCSDLMILKNYNPSQKVRIADNKALFLALNQNLSKNSTELRY